MSAALSFRCSADAAHCERDCDAADFLIAGAIVDVVAAPIKSGSTKFVVRPDVTMEHEMNPKIQNQVDEICRQNPRSKDLIMIAFQHELRAVDLIAEGDFSNAVEQGVVAAGIYEFLVQADDITDSQRLNASLSFAKVRMCQGAAYRRAEQYDESFRMFDEGERRLAEIRDDVFRKRRPEEADGTVSATAEPEQDVPLITDWVRTRGAMSMNKGVLLDSVGREQDALESWRDGEVTLFDEYVKLVGPEEDPECAGRVINLWENIMVTALKVGDAQRAAEVTGNALKLFVYWPAHDLEHPEEVIDAFGAFVGAFADLSAEHRKLIETTLPAPLVEMLDDLISGED